MEPKESKMKEETFEVLDHGYVRLVENWGSDERIIEAARMSTGKGFLGWGPKFTGIPKFDPKGERRELTREEAEDYAAFSLDHQRGFEAFHDVKKEPGDEKLLGFLYNNKHSTPFEMAGLIIEVQAPIFVFREWHRHRTQSYNELSARYTPLPDLNYVPSIERLMMNSNGTNKQAGTIAGADVLTLEEAQAYQIALRLQYKNDQDFYEKVLQSGVPKELARIHLPVGRYSRMRASANLRNWLQFLTLRMDSKAQWEIRQYANIVGSFIKELHPKTWDLFVGEAA